MKRVPSGRGGPAHPSAGERSLTSGPIVPTLLRLSLPNMFATLAIALVAFAETAYVGRLGTTQLAGIALVFPMVMLQQMMSAGAMGGGVSSAVSRALGAARERRAEDLALHATLIGAMSGAFFSVVFLAFGPSIFAMLGGRGEALAQALEYSNVVFLGAVSVWLTNTFASVLRGSGSMNVPSVTLFAVAALQVIFGGALGLGFGPIPRLGMAGVALGLVIAYSAGAAFLFVYLVSGRGRVRLRLRFAGLRGEMFRDILRVGALACVSPVQAVLTVLIVTRLVSRFGTEALAGYGIGARLEFLLVPLAFGIGVACVPMVGMAIGAGDVARARRVAWTGGTVTAVGVGALGLLAVLVPHLWAGQFTVNPAVLEMAYVYFAWAGPAYGFLGLGLCLYFASQGAGRVLGPVLAMTVRLLVIVIGGWWISGTHAEPWMIFALVGASMIAYGTAAAFAVHTVSWNPRRPGRV